MVVVVVLLLVIEKVAAVGLVEGLLALVKQLVGPGFLDKVMLGVALLMTVLVVVAEPESELQEVQVGVVPAVMVF